MNTKTLVSSPYYFIEMFPETHTLGFEQRTAQNITVLGEKRKICGIHVLISFFQGKFELSDEYICHIANINSALHGKKSKENSLT